MSESKGNPVVIHLPNIRAWIGGEPYPQTARTWDIHQILSTETRTAEAVAALEPFSAMDLQSAYKHAEDRKLKKTADYDTMRDWMDILRSAWNYLQVVPTIEKNNTLIKQAVRAIKESPPEHVGWRAWRSMRHLLTIPGNGRISYEARLRLLLEYPVGCIVAAKVRNKQYMDLASRGYEAKPEVQLVNTVRSMLLDVAAQLHKELATD